MYDSTSNVCVASVPTFNRRDTKAWESKVGLWMEDECHHLLRENQWGRAVAGMTNAYGLGVTATPCRIDRKGLGRHADGVFDTLVVGPTLADLMESGDLSKYRVVSTPLSKVIHQEMNEVGLRGNDYDLKETKTKLGNTITGDVVGTYKKFAMGLRGITFGVDIEHCERLAEAYNAAGVPAIALSSKTPEAERWKYLGMFERGEVLQLVNCDLFGEGFDVPACSCVSFVRPTKSYGLFVQQIGRPLRTHDDKPYAWIFDHVGNLEEHGLPDLGLPWTLDRGEKKSKRKNNTDSAIKLTTCTNPDCLSDYVLPNSHCPWCGAAYEVAIRKPLKVVDGELVELTEEELSQLRYKHSNIMMDASKFESNISKGYNKGAAIGMTRNHIERQKAHLELQSAMFNWAEYAQNQGLTPTQAQVQFAKIYGCDVFTAQTLSRGDAENLIKRIAS